MKSFLGTYFSSSDLARIASTIAELERYTSGEIRVSVIRRRRWSERSLSLEELAHRDFYRLGMDKTKDGTGVLLFLLLGERKFRIVADHGINERVGQETWDEIGGVLVTHFKNGHYLGGVLEALRRIGGVLQRHFPRAADDVDELPNNVDIRS
jgi:putative membrane protein